MPTQALARQRNDATFPSIWDELTWRGLVHVSTDPDALAQMNFPDGETAVEIPDRMIQFFRQEDRDTGNG